MSWSPWTGMRVRAEPQDHAAAVRSRQHPRLDEFADDGGQGTEQGSHHRAAPCSLDWLLNYRLVNVDIASRVDVADVVAVDRRAVPCAAHSGHDVKVPPGRDAQDDGYPDHWREDKRLQSAKPEDRGHGPRASRQTARQRSRRK